MRQLKIATQITNRDSQAVEKYLQEISKISMITPEEETTLAQRIKMGDQRALDKLVQAKIGTYNKANKAYMAFEQEHEREPSTEELAEILEMSETEINNIFQSNTRHTSLDAPVHEAEDVAMGDLLEGSDDTDEDVMKDSLREEIRRVLKSLSPREAEIVNAYFGLDGENGVTIEQIGMKYDLTKERIRQIKERAIKRLQKARYSNALKAYLG